jgi:hypothetical protein
VAVPEGRGESNLTGVSPLASEPQGEQMGAIRRIDELLATGWYELVEVRVLEAAKGSPLSDVSVAVFRRCSADLDDTYETILVELRDPEEQHYARSCLGQANNLEDTLY